MQNLGLMGHQAQNRWGSKDTEEINLYNSVKYLVLWCIYIYLYMNMNIILYPSLYCFKATPF